jgi:hypothetical protein
MTERFFAATRQVTGDPMRHLAYIIDRSTGKPVCTCQHRHVSRLRHGGKNGAFYAMRCAERMLRKLATHQ